MSVTIAGITFEHHEYDERGDVLYLSTAGYDGRRHAHTRRPRATTSSTTPPDRWSA